MVIFLTIPRNHSMSCIKNNFPLCREVPVSSLIWIGRPIVKRFVATLEITSYCFVSMQLNNITKIDFKTSNETGKISATQFTFNIYLEFFLGNAATCRQATHSSSFKDTEWATNTCTITFSTIGIWPENADGTDVNCCDRSHDSRFIVTGDDFGKVKLYSYPSIQPKVITEGLIFEQSGIYEFFVFRV